MEHHILFLVFLGTLLVATVRRFMSGRQLRKIRGPTSPDFLLGHQVILNSQPEVGILEKRWSKEFGTAWRLKGLLGEDQLAIADPKALQHILNKPGYRFPKSAVLLQSSREVAGESILTATGHDHARIRKIMNPAFSAGQLRMFVPLFQRIAHKMCDKWDDLLHGSSATGQLLDVHPWLFRCTSDIISEAAFDVDCGALDDSFDPALQTFTDTLAKVIPSPSIIESLSRSLCSYFPTAVLRCMKYLPMRPHIHFRRSLDIANKYSRELIQKKSAALLAGEDQNKRDILNILVRANASEDPSSSLSDPEMISIVATFLLAGNDTTALSISLLLYEIAKHHECQEEMRREIKTARSRVIERGDSDFSTSDLDGMSLVTAVIKESLRLNPILYVLSRVSSRDELLPLAYPIISASGESVNEIPVPRGTELLLSIETYNRLPQVWGPDADVFNPHRFINRGQVAEAHVGMAANLMTFGSGLQGCLGWRFAMLEIQVILVELIEKFTLALPAGGSPRIVRLPAGIMIPVVEGEREKGAQMPLYVRPVV